MISLYVTDSIQLSPGLFAGTAACLIVARLVAEQILARLNERHVVQNRGQVPDAYAHTMDVETYRKSADYTLARSRFGRWQDIWNAGMLLLVLFTGCLPWVFASGEAELGGGVWASAVVLFLVGAVISLLGIPWDYHEQFRLEERFGFNTTSVRTWIADRMKGIVISALLGIPVIAFLLKMMEMAGDFWWLWAWLGVLGFQALFMLIGPALILPLFNKLTPLPEGPLKDRLRALAERTGFTTKGIQIMDGSRRSRHSNAFFTGLGRFRRIVLFDTLTEQLDDAELEAVLAHEIGHYKLRHLPKLLASSAGGLLVAFFLLHVLLQQPGFYEAFGFAVGQNAPALLIFFLLAGTVGFWISPVTNRLSRKHEYEADAFAVRSIGATDPLTSSLRKLSKENLSNLTPHPAYSAFYYSHPTLLEREEAMRNPP